MTIPVFSSGDDCHVSTLPFVAVIVCFHQIEMRSYQTIKLDRGKEELEGLQDDDIDNLTVIIHYRLLNVCNTSQIFLHFDNTSH